MSLQHLVDGDCTGLNSLIRLTSHLTQDHGFQDEGLQRERVFPPGQEISVADRFVEQFLEETHSAQPQTFKMDGLLREMQKIEYGPSCITHVPQRNADLVGQDSAWASQYLASGCHFDENHPDAIWNSSLNSLPGKRIIQPLTENESSELGLGPLWADEYLEHRVSLNNNNNNNLIKELDEPGREDENSAKEHSKFMKYMSNESDVLMEKNFQKPSTSNPYEKWSESGPSSAEDTVDYKTDNLKTAEAWANELKNDTEINIDPENYESVFWARLEKEWNKIPTLNNLIDSHPWLPEYEKYYDPFTEYKFNTDNPMKDVNNAQFTLEEGKKRLEAGDLQGAVLCFEAAVQSDPKNAEAWLLLGKTQAENEQEPMAICALKNCLQLDPSNSVALMSLAISYSNESYQNQACLTLKEWISKHEKYKHLVFASDPQPRTKSNVSTLLFNDLHNEVKELYIKAARLNPRDDIDPDVQNGLGVLFTLTCEHDKAADCFQAALSARPDDYRLWNRYGATLANGHRSEEAIPAYRRVFELAPGFIRARYNLGISCINLGAYKEAAEQFLTALNQQAAGRGVQGEKIVPGATSDAIWSSLKVVLSLMHKYHLNEAVDNRDLATLNKEFEIE